MTTKYYRWVKDDMTSENGNAKWELNKWNKVEGKLVLCNNGLHAYLDIYESMTNVFGNRWFICEVRGKKIKEKDSTKICSSEMRLIKEIPSIVFKRFALFCAKDCLKYYEKEYPNDKRISECIRINELFFDGKATLDELNAARSAAWSAAESVAWSAAESAARSAARSAAWSAARSAAESAARSAAELRQKKELLRLIKRYT